MGHKALTLVLGIATLVCLGMAQSNDAWKAPPEEAAKPNPEAKNPDAVATGRKLFMRTCVGCHEEDGSGKDTGAANLRAPEVQNQKDGELFWKITNGNVPNGMPSFAKLSDTERWDLVTFVHTLKDAPENGAAPAPEKKVPPHGSGKSKKS